MSESTSYLPILWQ